MNQADGKLKNCGPVAHRLGESIASQIIAILYARHCPGSILALLPAAGGPVAHFIQSKPGASTTGENAAC
jgi:hypothetical protein